MNQLRTSQLEPGMSVLFKVLNEAGTELKENWSLDIIGYVEPGWVTLMSYGPLSDRYPYFEYNQLNKTFLLIKSEYIDESDLATHKINLKGLL